MTAAKITKKRDVNLDLLRIVSMLLIVFFHSIDHSGVLEAAEAAPKAMYFYVRFTYALCQVCVNCYVLLSGYYLVCARFQLQKLAALWMETVFYALLFKGLFMALGTVPFSPVSLVGCFFPILTGRYWFLTIYVGMYLVFPFLNLLVGAMDRRQHTLLNFCLFCLFSLWNSIHPAIAGMNSGGGWGLAWFVVLYLAAAWFRLYYTPSGRPTFAFAAFFLLPLLMAAAQMAAELTGIGILQTVLKNWFRYDSAPVFLMTLCLFTAFLSVRIRSEKVSRCICAAAPLTLGIYLIHNHANVSPWLWETLALPEKMGSAFFPAIQAGCVLGIFAVCLVLDAIRKYTVGRLERCTLVTALCGRVTHAADKLVSRI